MNFWVGLQKYMTAPLYGFIWGCSCVCLRVLNNPAYCGFSLNGDVCWYLYAIYLYKNWLKLIPYQSLKPTPTQVKQGRALGRVWAVKTITLRLADLQERCLDQRSADNGILHCGTETVCEALAPWGKFNKTVLTVQFPPSSGPRGPAEAWGPKSLWLPSH